VQGKKVGFASVSMRPADPRGRVLWRVAGRLRSSGQGAATDVSFDESRLYEARPPYRLVEIRSREDSGAGVVERVYRSAADAMVVAQTTDGRVQPERRLPPSQETLLAVLDQSVLEPSQLRVGQRAVVSEFDSDAEIDKRTTIKVVDVRRERMSGVEALVAVLAAQSQGEQAVTESQVAAGGVTLRASLGDGIDLRWEEKARAQSDVVGFDMIADAVEVDRPLGDPAEVRELHLVVGVGRNFTLRDAPNQVVKRRPDGKLEVALRARAGAPVLPAERVSALRDDGRSDLADPAVVTLARQLTAGGRDREEQVGRLVDWVFENLTKSFSSNLTTASQVLARRAGDCTEHALLLVALARAAGIPAREVSGLVYMGDDLRRFGWHAWVEVDIDGHWVQVDPSSGERLANATHLTLGAGDDSDWVTTMGALTISLADAGE
jgi:Transglutaminase-like superfamily